MANIKITAPIGAMQLAALNNYNLATAFNGVNNVREILEMYTNVKFVADRSNAAADCTAKNTNDKLKDLTVVQLGIKAWLAIADDLFTNFATSDNAQILMPFLVNANFLNFANFNRTSIYENTALGGQVPAINFVPTFMGAVYKVGAADLKDGAWGDETRGAQLINGSANLVEFDLGSIANGVNVNVSTYDAALNVKEAGAQNTAVANGVLSINLTPSAGDPASGMWRFTKFVYKTVAQNNALLINLDMCLIPGFSNMQKIGFA